MKETTKQRKKATKTFEEIYGRSYLNDRLYQVFAQGKQGFDALVKGLGRIMAETITYIEREETAGTDYQPISSDIKKRASQGGSAYIADQKVPVQHPRVRSQQGEITLKSYKRLKEPDGFSEELLAKVMRGISCRKYGETAAEAAEAFGVSPSSVSSRIIEATAKQLEEFKERLPSNFKAFAIFLDTIHRGFRRRYDGQQDGIGILAGRDREPRDMHGTACGHAEAWIGIIKEDNMGNGWGEGNNQGIEGGHRQEADTSAMRYS